MSFVLNASLNTLITNDLLELVGYRKNGACDLCYHPICSTIHVLSCCPVALKSKRFTWRHDSVLLNLKVVLSFLVRRANSPSAKPPSRPPLLQSFVKAGVKPSSSRTSSPRRRCLLDPASDWKILVELDHDRLVFPPEIFATDLRPDIIVWSPSTKHVVLGELTCPAEENITAASTRKEGRYANLVASIRDQKDNPWKVSLFTLEVGARGFVANSVRVCLRQLGASNSEASRVCKALSKIVSRYSYAIYLARSHKKWFKKALLLDTTLSGSFA